MIRLLQTVCLAAVAVAACSESAPTAPCTVTQLDQTHYEATATWSGLSATRLEFWRESTVLAVSVFGHPIRSGSVTDTLSSAPTYAEVIGKTTGVKVLCGTVF